MAVRTAQEPPIVWTQNYVPLAATRPFAEPHPGPANRYPNGTDTSVNLFFDEMFSNELWDMMVEQTNTYYEQQKAANPNKHKSKWSPVEKGEIKVFIGIIIYIVKLPRMHMYWSTDTLIHQQSVSAIISRTRFLQIWRYFHLADNEHALPRENPSFDKIYRVRKFLNIIMENAQKLYRLTKNILIDESMVPHKGRLSFKQYIKNKPVKWGIKLWVLCEAKTGYIYKFQVYLGKEWLNTEHNLARRVVKHLVSNLENKYHHLYMDNFYCDPYLFQELETKKVLACGTIRCNRKGFPKDLVITKAMEKRMNRGDFTWRCSGNLVAHAWFDNHPVYLITTIHPPESIGAPCTIQRKSGTGGALQEIPCPPAEIDYTNYMGGVDLADQVTSTFSVIRKSRKAWKKLFYYGLEVSLLNSYIIYRQTVNNPKDFLNYRLAIVRHLTEGRCFRGTVGRPSSRPQSDLDTLRRNGLYHSIAVEEKRRYCVVCAKKVALQNLSTNQISKTNTVCVTCDRKPLCVLGKRSCWEKWHTLQEYWH